MLKTKAIFERKTDDFQPKDCVIEKTIRLTAAEYDVFSRHMLRDYDFIKDNIDLMYSDSEGAYHCLLLVGEDRPDGILIESEGYDYARYSAFLPNAADFLAAHQEQEQTEKQQQSASGFKLQDLVCVPLEDIHLVHSDEGYRACDHRGTEIRHADPSRPGGMGGCSERRCGAYLPHDLRHTGGMQRCQSTAPR